MTKMTEREIYTGIMNGTLDAETVSAFCEKKIAALDARAEKAKERAAAKREAGDELQSLVLNALTDEFATRDEITAKVDFEDVSVAKIGYRLTSLVKAGLAEKSEATIPGVDGGKARKVAVYRLMA